MRALTSDRLRRVAQENALLVLGAAVMVLGSLIQVRVLTGYLSPGEYGQLALAQTLANLVNQVVMCGLISGIGRFYSIAVEKRAQAEYLSSSFALLRRAAVVVLVPGLAVALGLVLYGKPDWAILTVATLLYAMLNNLNGTFGDIQNAARRRGVVSFHNGLEVILRIALAVAAIHLLGVSSIAVMFGFGVAALVVFASHRVWLRRTIPQAGGKSSSEPPSKDWMRQIWAYAWPFSAWGIFTWLQQASDRWSLEVFVTTDEVGLYTVLYQLGYAPIGMISGLLSAFLIPIFFQRAGDATNHERNANVHRVNWMIAWAGIAITLAGFVVTLTMHDWIFRLLVAEHYRASSYLLCWFVLAGGMFATGQLLAVKLLSEMRTRQMLPVKISTALVGVLLNVLGARFGGLHGVVIGMVIFSFLYLLSTAALARRTESRPLA